MSIKRSIKSMAVPGIVPSVDPGAEPIFEWVDPCSLLVDEAYQRNLSERSVTLIRKIVGRWSWSKFKPPIVVITEHGHEVVDGQHTAIAAATHPSVRRIPVMIVEADSLQARADAFLGHNADRIAVTPLQMHHAAVLAGDETALTINQVCERAGARILKQLPGSAYYKIGDCVSVSTVRSLVNRRGAMGARRILQVCVEAKRSPIGAAELRAVEELLFGEVRATEGDIVSALLSLGDAAEQKAKAYAANHDCRMWQGMVEVIRRRAAA